MRRATLWPVRDRLDRPALIVSFDGRLLLEFGTQSADPVQASTSRIARQYTHAWPEDCRELMKEFERVYSGVEARVERCPLIPDNKARRLRSEQLPLWTESRDFEQMAMF